MQIPILQGVYAGTNADFRTSYPRNLYPVPKKTGISDGYLKPAEGLVQITLGPGNDRGGINWNGVHYRAMGSSLVTIDAAGNLTNLGDIGNGNRLPVTFDYSFDRLGISSGGILYYYDGSSLTHVTDPDLSQVIDFIWVDGYFLCTDGTSLIVTELNDPYSVNPLKYGSSEADPDPIVALLKLRNEVYALNRYTIEVFTNIGGPLFPFQRIAGAEIMRGPIGTHACCIYSDAIAFLGSGLDEPPSIWVGLNGLSTKIATREIDVILQKYSLSDLTQVVLEPRIDKGHVLIYVHLPDRTLVYDASASKDTQAQVWFFLDSALGPNPLTYRARNLVWCYDQWNFGDPISSIVGTFSEEISSHYGNEIAWSFGTIIFYNASNGIIIHELELVSLTGAVEAGANPTIWKSYSTDGVTYSLERPIKAGKQGDRSKRLSWLQNGNMRLWRIERFRSTSSAHIAPARLEARIEPLYD